MISRHSPPKPAIRRTPTTGITSGRTLYMVLTPWLPTNYGWRTSLADEDKKRLLESGKDKELIVFGKQLILF